MNIQETLNNQLIGKTIKAVTFSKANFTIYTEDGNLIGIDFNNGSLSIRFLNQDKNTYKAEFPRSNKKTLSKRFNSYEDARDWLSAMYLKHIEPNQDLDSDDYMTMRQFSSQFKKLITIIK